MENFKGTPGPWRVDGLKRNNGIINWSIVSCNSGGTIADMLRFNPYPIPEETIEANASLIAAAPEMLHLLNSMMLSIKAHPDFVSGENQEFIDYVKMAEELINKVII